MKRTPDGISKKRQELRRQMDVWKEKIIEIKYSESITKEEKIERLKVAHEQLKALDTAMYNTFKLVGRKPSPQFYTIRRLYPGVM